VAGVEDTRGFTAAYNSVKRFCEALRQREPEQFDRLEFSPGEESQVDYGRGRAARCTEDGQVSQAAIVHHDAALLASLVPQVVWKSSAEVWARLHERAFRYFQGVTQYVVWIT